MAVNEKRLSIAMMIETVLMGGAEQVVLQLSNELRSRGHIVHPVVPSGREDWLLDRFREHGLEWQTYDLHRAIDFALPARLAAMFARLGIDVVHSHEFVMAVYGAPAARRAGVPLVITMHGNQAMTRRLRRRMALRWAFARADATVAVSEDTRRHLIESLGVSPASVCTVPNGIPIRRGRPEPVREELGLLESEPLLLCVGSLMKRKGHAVLIEALARLRAGGLDLPWRLAIAGEGDERPRLEALIAELGFEDRVHLLGRRNDVPDLLAAADVFLMPSLWEGLPLAILEAMFAARPVIASATSGIPEAIENEREGLLVPPGDVDALAEAVRRILTDPTLSGRLGRAAHDRATKDFTVAAMADRYERIYYDALRAAPGRSGRGDPHAR